MEENILWKLRKKRKKVRSSKKVGKIEFWKSFSIIVIQKIPSNLNDRQWPPIHFSSCSNGIDQSLLHRIPIERRELFATRAKIVHIENRGYFPRYNWFDTVQFLKGHWQMVQVNDPVYWLVRWTASIFQLPKKNYRLSINIYRTLHR